MSAVLSEFAPAHAAHAEPDVHELAQRVRSLQERVDDLEAEAAESYKFIQRMMGRLFPTAPAARDRRRGRVR